MQSKSNQFCTALALWSAGTSTASKPLFHCCTEGSGCVGGTCEGWFIIIWTWTFRGSSEPTSKACRREGFRQQGTENWGIFEKTRVWRVKCERQTAQGAPPLALTDGRALRSLQRFICKGVGWKAPSLPLASLHIGSRLGPRLCLTRLCVIKCNQTAQAGLWATSDEQPASIMPVLGSSNYFWRGILWSRNLHRSTPPQLGMPARSNFHAGSKPCVIVLSQCVVIATDLPHITSSVLAPSSDALCS